MSKEHLRQLEIERNLTAILHSEVRDKPEAEVDPTRKAYDDLPDSIKLMYTYKEWSWLPDREKADLVTFECMPDDEICD